MYDAKLPEVIETQEQLDEVIDKLVNIRKFVVMENKNQGGKVISALNDDEPKRHYKPREPRGTDKWETDKESALLIIRTHYHGTKPEKLALAKELDKNWDKIVKTIISLRRKYDIKPNDVSLSRWPTRMDFEWKQNPEINLALNGGKPINIEKTTEKEKVIENTKEQRKTYTFSLLNDMGWDHLNQLCKQWSIDEELYLQCKITNSKEALITELRKVMRIYENNQRLFEEK